jgi:hypothetical protein
MASSAPDARMFDIFFSRTVPSTVPGSVGMCAVVVISVAAIT